MKTLLVISHTEHYIDSKGQVVGWGSTITELNYVSSIFKKVIHAAPLHQVKPPKSSLPYVENIQFIPLKPSGGRFLKKFSIVLNAPHNLKQIEKVIEQSDIIQFRAPTGIGLYVLPYLKYINTKPYWVKYAGNWNSENLPLGNKLQKWWLQKIVGIETKVTVNGKWLQERQNIVAFENPCLTETDRNEGREHIKVKKVSQKKNYCFVGGLNDNKGIKELVEVITKITNKNIGKLHIVGDGYLRKELEKLVVESAFPIIFYGFLPKNEIVEVYKKSHFILLPSKSEGFPKVIGEAMNFGCVPIVSDVSCIGQYIKNGYNGFLINPNDEIDLKLAIEKSLMIGVNDFKKFQEINYQLANNFTYKYYLIRIQLEIIDKV